MHSSLSDSTGLQSIGHLGSKLTIVYDTSVFAQQAQVLLFLLDDALVLGPQAGGVAGEDEGVAVEAGAVSVDLSAGVVDGVVIVVGVDHPVVVV